MSCIISSISYIFVRKLTAVGDTSRGHFAPLTKHGRTFESSEDGHWEVGEPSSCNCHVDITEEGPGDRRVDFGCSKYGQWEVGEPSSCNCHVDITKDGPGDRRVYFGSSEYGQWEVGEPSSDSHVDSLEDDGYKAVFSSWGNVGGKVYAASLGDDPFWRITVYKDKHICIPNGECEMFTVPVIARIFLDKIREEPKYYMLAKMEKIVMEKWKISVTRPQCQAARRKALGWISSEYDTHFNDDGEDVFNRFYVYFDVLRRTWKASCRPIIGVDGCFLKEKIKGQLLAALGRDADNAIYSIAWSVIQVENTDNWQWFVNRLKIDLDLGDGDGYIIMSDRQKGLIKVVELELPKLEHRKCVRHIYGHLKKSHPNKKLLKKHLCDLAWSYNTTKYDQNLERIHTYDSKVDEDVLKTKPKTWCRAFHKLGNYCEDVENNFIESFNNTINKAREKPFVAMLEMVRKLAMVRIAKRSALSHDHKGICTLYVKRFLAKEHEKAFECFVSPTKNGMYEVQLGYDKHRFCLRTMRCTCMKYQICGIPCEHAYVVILKKTLKPEDYVCQWFKTSKWQQNYKDGLIPQRGPRFWPSTGGNDVHAPASKEDNITKADKKRKKGVNESATKKKPKEKKRIMHCGICGAPDHNRRFHQKKNAT
ncbi:PREDICTED: uncharacterized protein LOC104728099 [Camelina sativa]|uniref:Uncharacterized protein LOC104728099 n=1 Tax=Camelina sativa TaxID=90675 RepID=A0ABM1QL04_CAMSA|nr:PREDICTED: uncharacterized protein LOC104728099 [Camelina sativa]